MKKFSLNQLLYANEVCFPADFLKLFEKHAQGTLYQGLGNMKMFDFKNKFNSNLLNWISQYSRADLNTELGIVIHGILADLIKNYE